MISASLCVAPIYMLAGWALWVRIQQYGWTPDRLYGALTVSVLLVWSFGYLIGLLRRGRDPVSGKAGDTERLFVDAGDIAVAGLACT